MNRNIFVWSILILLSTHCFAQRRAFRCTSDVVSVGIGVGIDHGGVGGSLIYYPKENFGFFAAGGYAVAGFAYNAGMKLRMTRSQTIQPFVTAMYGNNAVVTATPAAQDKLFLGATLGAGVDLRPKGASNYFSLALLVPIKGSEVDEYANSQIGRGGSFNSASMPVSISIGYRFVIKDNDY